MIRTSTQEIDSYFPRDLSKKSLLAAQRLVSGRALIRDDFGEIRVVAGVDQAFIHDKIISGILVLDYFSLEILEHAYSVELQNYPYIPTFLSFREGPAIIRAFKKLRKPPDVLLVDGVGINHPRRAGLATHVGVALDVPTIGITKKILCGSGNEPRVAGEASPLTYERQQVGWILKSGQRNRFIIVAPGHRVSLDSSLSIVKACLRGHKLPEPAKLAHEYVNKLKKELQGSLSLVI